MNRRGKTFFSVVLGLILSAPVWAHVNLIYPEGGETFEYGKKVNIQWETLIEHVQNDWDLYFSPDGGANWEAIELDMNVNQTSYSWTVPESMTEQGRVKIFQDNVGSNYDDVSGDFIIQDPQAGIHAPQQFPRTFTLFPNYPNPFNPLTSIRYDLHEGAYVTLTVYDILGGEVKTLVRGLEEPGSRSVTWDGTDDRGEPVGSGIYLYRIHVGDPSTLRPSTGSGRSGQPFTQTRRMILLR